MNQYISKPKTERVMGQTTILELLTTRTGRGDIYRSPQALSAE